MSRIKNSRASDSARNRATGDKVPGLPELPGRHGDNLDGIEYDEKQLSKPGSLHLLLSFERIDVVINIRRSSLTVSETELETKEAA